MRITDYIREEVSRQGHDLSDPADGGLRVRWMTEAWRYADRKLVAYPSVSDIEQVGKLVEQVKNRHGFRQCGVRVGDRLCPPPEQVPGLIARLVEHGTGLSSLEWYREYELIHPFADGNGRSGKIWLNCLANTLRDPFFPPADFWAWR